MKEVYASYFFPHEKQSIFYEKNRFFSIFKRKDNDYYWVPYKLGLEPFNWIVALDVMVGASFS